MTSSYKNNHPRFGDVLIAAWVSMASAHVFAETALERQALSAPMLHEAKLGGKEVLVHLVSLHGYLQGKPDNATRLAQLKRDVSLCAESHRENGRPVKLPIEWPDHLNGVREDVYLTRNFSISYMSSWVYAMSPLDCSLIEEGGTSTSASLTSSAGGCRIDLVKKTANGQCSLETHRNARVARSQNGRVPAEVIDQLKRNPAIPASIAAQLADVGPVPGNVTKNILGLSCRQEKLLDDAYCSATGGTFTPSKKLVLERISPHGINMTAKRAALDVRIEEGVFTPHLAGGFKIRNFPGPQGAP